MLTLIYRCGDTYCIHFFCGTLTLPFDADGIVTPTSQSDLVTVRRLDAKRSVENEIPLDPFRITFFVDGANISREGSDTISFGIYQTSDLPRLRMGSLKYNLLTMQTVIQLGCCK